MDVLGTWMLSILDGHCRYAHVGALRGDGVATHILGMSKVVSDDSLRRALLGNSARASGAAHRGKWGDCAFGNEGDMKALEELGQP